MPKRRGKRKAPEARESSDDEAPDPRSREFFNDEIDDLMLEKEKLLLEKGIPQAEYDEESDQEGVMDLNLSDETDDDDEDIDMKSDLEDEERDGLPNEKAWGKKRGMYYNTDYQDKDYMGFGGSDGEAAEAEEKEALAIQKRMAQTLQDSDFGLADFQVNKKVEAEAPKKITKNLSAMSKREKLQLLNLESPEFLGIVDDFKSKMAELMRIEPLVPLITDGLIPDRAGAAYLQTKYHLLLTYLTNIGFYLILKARHVPVGNHPVVKRILEFRMLLQQLEVIDEKVRPELEEIIEKVEKGEALPFSMQENNNPSEKSRKHTSKAKDLQRKIKEEVKLMNETMAHTPTKEIKKRQKSVKFSDTEKNNNETEDEKKALELYRLMKRIKNGNSGIQEEEISEDEDMFKPDSEVQDDEDEQQTNDNTNDEIMNDDEHGDDDEQSNKRGITYQIAKNKGVTPHRKKERRNPRVKHRTKFKKAKVRRKGQVREPRTEVSKYGGEISGIRSGVRHSVKLK